MIQTSRLRIRAFEEGDRELVVKLLMDPEFMQHSLNGAFDEVGAHERFSEILGHSKRGIGKQAIIEKNSLEIIGYCGLEPFSFSGRTEIELGYRIILAKRNCGFATEAARAIAQEYSQEYSGVIYAYVEKENIGSIKVLKKVGFDYCGEIMLQNNKVQLFEYPCNN